MLASGLIDISAITCANVGGTTKAMAVEVTNAAAAMCRRPIARWPLNPPELSSFVSSFNLAMFFTATSLYVHMKATTKPSG